MHGPCFLFLSRRLWLSRTLTEWGFPAGDLIFLLSYMRAFVSVGWTGFLLHFYLPGDGWTIWFSPEGHTTLFIAGRLLVHYLWWYDWCWVLLVSGAHVCSCISILSFEANANSALGCCGHANAGPQYRLCFVSIEEALSPKVRKNPVMFGEQMVARDDVFFLWNEELFRTPESWKSQGSFTWTFPNINSELQPSWGHNARFSEGSCFRQRFHSAESSAYVPILLMITRYPCDHHPRISGDKIHAALSRIKIMPDFCSMQKG